MSREDCEKNFMFLFFVKMQNILPAWYRFLGWEVMVSNHTTFGGFFFCNARMGNVDKGNVYKPVEEWDVKDKNEET